MSADGFATKESSIETVKSLSRSVKVSKGDVDLACRIFLHVNAGDRAILGLAFVLHILGEVLVPIELSFPANCGSKRNASEICQY